MFSLFGTNLESSDLSYIQPESPGANAGKDFSVSQSFFDTNGANVCDSDHHFDPLHSISVEIAKNGEELNASSCEDFQWDALDDAMMDLTIPIWLFPSSDLSTNSTVTTTVTDSTEGPKMDPMFLLQKDSFEKQSQPRFPFIGDFDHTPLDDGEFLFQDSGFAYEQLDLLQKESSQPTWLERTVPANSQYLGEQSFSPPFETFLGGANKLTNHNVGKYSNHCGLRGLHSQPLTATQLGYSSLHPESFGFSVQQENTTRKRKLQFAVDNDGLQEERAKYYRATSDGYNDLEYDSEDMDLKLIKPQSNKPGYTVQSNMQFDKVKNSSVGNKAISRLQEMIDSINDPVGKYMRKRGLSAVDAVYYNVHELLLQAPKKPRQRYGPRQKKKQMNSNEHEDGFDGASAMTNAIGSGFQPVGGYCFKHPESQREDEQSDEEGNNDDFGDTQCVHDDITRTRNREHARATRRRRRIFKEIDSLLHQHRAGAKKPVATDPLYPGHYHSS